MVETSEASATSRATLISGVKSPIGFLTLGVLIIEAISGGLAIRAEGHDFTVLIYGMLGVFVLLLVGFFLMAFFRPASLTAMEQVQTIHQAESRSSIPVHFDYDVFVAAPMAATKSEAEYAAVREELLHILECLRSACGFQQVYYAGEHITTKKDFDAEALAIKDDFDRLKQSRYFLMVFMRPVVTSALVEAGVALALGKPSVLLVRETGDLPFLLRNAPQAFPQVRIYECANMDRVQALMNRSRERLFTG